MNPIFEYFGTHTEPTSHNLSFAVPSNAVPGITYARFRISIDQNLAPTGEASNGEVEDYLIEILQPPTQPTPTPTPSQPPSGDTVGGHIYSVNKIGLLIPWIALAVIILAAGLFLIRRRVHSQ